MKEAQATALVVAKMKRRAARRAAMLENMKGGAHYHDRRDEEIHALTKSRIEGWLLMGGGKIKRWNRRYVVAESGTLRIFARESEKHNEAKAKGAHTVSAVERWEGRSFGIKVTTAEGEELVFAGADQRNTDKMYYGLVDNTPESLARSGRELAKQRIGAASAARAAREALAAPAMTSPFAKLFGGGSDGAGADSGRSPRPSAASPSASASATETGSAPVSASTSSAPSVGSDFDDHMASGEPAPAAKKLLTSICSCFGLSASEESASPGAFDPSSPAFVK